MVAVPILGPAQPGPAPCPLLLRPGRNSQERTPQVQPSSSQGSELWVSTESLQKLWEELMDPEAQTTPAWQPLCAWRKTSPGIPSLEISTGLDLFP